MSSSFEQNQYWESVDFINTRPPINQAADVLQQFTAANPYWKVLQFNRQGQLMIALGSSDESIHHGGGSLSPRPLPTNEVIQQGPGNSSILPLLTNNDMHGNGKVIALNPMSPYTPVF
ncbi:hypothetical protein ACA910_013590 [Epithemia clementina (nom. ined.)]